MPRKPLSDEFSPEDLDGADFAASFDNGEVFGPSAATREAQLAPESREDNLELEVGGGVQNRFGILSKAKFTCVVCLVNLQDHQNLLHVHHPALDKDIGSLSHLMVLCLSCHANMPDHSFMRDKYDPESFRTIDKLKAAQGKTIPKPRQR